MEGVPGVPWSALAVLLRMRVEIYGGTAPIKNLGYRESVHDPCLFILSLAVDDVLEGNGIEEMFQLGQTCTIIWTWCLGNRLMQSDNFDICCSMSDYVDENLENISVMESD
eukprot:1565209-Amphidinium_carterae.1